MSPSGTWRVLGIAATDDVKAIRKAYADKLRAMDVDRDAAGYAALRQARDTALYLAKQQTEVSDGELTAFRDEVAIEGDGEPPADLEFEGSTDFDEPPPPGRERQAGPDVAFVAILFPNGEYSEEPLTDEEWDRADAALAEIVGAAQGGDLVHQHSADMWVADCLARAWPRSSMLLERAAAAFDWEKERGQIHEGPAQAFLNARLRGMRFLAELEQPGHWGHNAWSELSTPGKKGLFGRFRANGHEVRTLLSTIRENFAELESYLDREKVQSWDQPVSSPWFGTGTAIMVVFIALQFLAMCSRVATTDFDEQSAPPAVVSGPQHDARREEIAQRIFGPGAAYVLVETRSPALARSIDAEASSKDDTDTEIIMRRWMFAIAPAAAFDHLVRIQQLKLDYALLARRVGGTDACAELLERGNVPVGSEPSEDLRARERVLALELLQAGAFQEVPKNTGKLHATIPGVILIAAQQASGLTLDKARAVAGGGGTAEERCLFQTALMAEVLRQSGRVEVDLLRIL